MPRKRDRHLPVDHAEDRLHQVFHRGEDGLLVDERHLDVDLRELRLPIGAQVLVAEALDDLKVPIHPGDHQDLLEDLRRLRQGVELARVQPARHEVIARSLPASTW